MKNIFRFSGFLLLIIFIISCKKDTPVFLPSVATGNVTEVLYATATAAGTVTDEGGGYVNVRGVCYGRFANPTTDSLLTADGTGKGEYSSFLNGLKQGTLYHLRAYAINSKGTVYGKEVTFTTKVPGLNFNSSLTYGTLTDIEGISYKTISIGSQLWMAENLRTSRFNDGTSIPKLATDAEWSNVITPAYCWFNNNDTLYGKIYGAYYNWFAVSTGKLCPDGWHVPTDDDWQQMINYLGGNNSAGSKIKEVGTNNWVLPNTSATNASGFTALPTGMRGSVDGTFAGQGSYGGWWTATESNPSPMGAAWTRWIHADTTVVVRSEVFKKDGFGIRCVKD
jgi:uncharacterized protein (TIGR02145 family)